MTIARMRSTVLDCRDTRTTAEFYRDLLGWEITEDDGGGWIVVSDGVQRLSFQRAPDHQPPRWPDPAFPQQLHIDVTVDDLDTAEPQVLALGARKADVQPSEKDDFRVYLDPAGHPFCLCVD